MGREQTSNSNLVESSATTRGGDGLETPHLPLPHLPIKPVNFALISFIFFHLLTKAVCLLS